MFPCGQSYPLKKGMRAVFLTSFFYIKREREREFEFTWGFGGVLYKAAVVCLMITIYQFL